ncbi:unnamed protein product [Protopolystoma xenopodis]|uniref:Uncharacterized protein n=1 Tax=Protopolystoma xenopodis TaxID=117903 RepID=A0A3S5C1Q6_9PLAT|nr:unnamed protein product [Protopolystoma xenopodis]
MVVVGSVGCWGELGVEWQHKSDVPLARQRQSILYFWPADAEFGPPPSSADVGDCFVCSARSETDFRTHVSHGPWRRDEREREREQLSGHKVPTVGQQALSERVHYPKTEPKKTPPHGQFGRCAHIQLDPSRQTRHETGQKRKSTRRHGSTTRCRGKVDFRDSLPILIVQLISISDILNRLFYNIQFPSGLD